jgi:diacylglycerol kinase family enzyme
VRVRALLIVNPRATSTTRLRRDVIASALASAVQLDVVETRYRGHATKLASAAGSQGYGLVLTLGGDGTVNEAVNGIVGCDLPASELPALAALPGGNANVFTGALHLPRDPVDATGEILRALAERRERTIGLGLAGDRYFTFNSGLGLDAEVVRAVQGVRAAGKPVTSSLYVRLALRQFYRQTDRRKPSLVVEVGDQQGDSEQHRAEQHGVTQHGPAFLGIVSNTAPWTYLGRREVQTTPHAGFDTGLDVLAVTRMSSLSTLHLIGQMFTMHSGQIRGRGFLSFHDQPQVTLRADRPVAFQVDGEYIGEREHVTFRSVPKALRVVA